MKTKTIFSALNILIATSYAWADNYNPYYSQEVSDIQHNKPSYQQPIISEIPKNPKTIHHTSQNIINNETKTLLPTRENEHLFVQSIFASINKKDWINLRTVLADYQTLPEYSLALVSFSKGFLARNQGDFAQAERYFRQAVLEDPNFSRGQLELARSLFDNGKNEEAETLFASIYPFVPPEIQATISSYQSTIKHRNDWQVAFSLGVLHQTNLNQKSGGSSCYDTLIINGQSICSQRRSTEPAIQDNGWNLYLNANKPIIKRNQHALQFQSNIYGTQYNHHTKYNNQTINIALGYRFKTAKQNISLMPFYENYWLNSHSLYNGIGVNVSYLNQPTPKTGISLQSSYQYNQFRHNHHQRNNGYVFSNQATLIYQPSERTLFFFGLGQEKKAVEDSSESFNRLSSQLGFHHKFNNQSRLTTSISHRHTRYETANRFIDSQAAKNEELAYSMSYALPNIKLRGFYPVLSYKYQDNRSNIPWFYNYTNHEATLKLQADF